MTKVSMTTDLNVAADKLWQLVGNFNGLPDWHPGVEKSELKEEGQVRKLDIKGGGVIVEKLIKKSSREKIYSYTIEDSPLPVSNYIAKIKVKDNGKGKSIVEWSSEFVAKGATEKDAIDAVQGVYQTGLDNLKKMFDV